ncbi:MAG: hypothetical protein AB8H79_26195 [Myxococcota bacterium]
MTDSILELVTQAGPWGWLVAGAAILLWAPNIALVALAASGRRVPVSAFLGVAAVLLGLGCIGSIALSGQTAEVVQAMALDRKLGAAASGLRLSVLPLVLVGRFAPALLTMGALSMAVGVWMRAPETRFWAGRQAAGPAFLAGLAACVALWVDPRVALAAVGGALALGLVSAADDDDGMERRFLVGRRVAVGTLVLSAMGLAILAPAAAAIARGDGAMAAVAWPLAVDVAYYAPNSVLSRYGVLPAALAPVGLTGLGALMAVLPLSARIGGRRLWMGVTASSLAVTLAGMFALGAAQRHQQVWDSALPPRTQVPVPQVDQILEGHISRRLTWTPRGIQDQGKPILQERSGLSALDPAPPGADPVLLTHIRRRRGLRASHLDADVRRRMPWDVEIPSVTRVSEVLPLLRTLEADPDIDGGIDLVVVGKDGFAGTLVVGLTADPAKATSAARLPVVPNKTWGEVVRQIDRMNRRGEAVMLVLPPVGEGVEE